MASKRLVMIKKTAKDMMKVSDKAEARADKGRAALKKKKRK